MAPRSACALLLLLPLLGCAQSSPEPSEGGAQELTPATCTTNVAADVPEFFRTYFRCVTITMNGANVRLRSDGLPPHRSYYYGAGHPNYEEFDTSRGPQYRPNPNRIASRAVSIEVPLGPVAKGLDITPSLVDRAAGTSALELPLGTVGMAVNGVALFSGLAGPGDRIEDEQFTFDRYHGHPERQGQYHYHSPSAGPLEALRAAGLVTNATPGQAEVEVYGILCDGTVILGCTELDGSRVAGADFDAQNGHVHDLRTRTGALAFAGRYHVHLCSQLFARPFTPEIQYYQTCGR